jgi:hypothetical protein
MNKPIRENRKIRRQKAFPTTQGNLFPHVPEALRFPGWQQARPARGHAPSPLARIYGLILRVVERLAGQFQKRQHRRKLQLLEIQQLGEKRFIAIVQVGRQKYLIGGAAASVSLLAEIHAQRATIATPRPMDQERA